MPGSETKGTGKAATYPNANLGKAVGGTKDKPGRHPPVKNVEGEIRTLAAKGGRIKAAHGWGRTNLLDESRRIKSEPQTRNVIDEEARVRGELNRGFKKGGKS